MLASMALFSGLSKFSKVPLGSLAKASSVGAKTVNGPLPFNASTNPAAWMAATKVLNFPLAIATSTMVLGTCVGFEVGEIVFIAVGAGVSEAAGTEVGAIESGALVSVGMATGATVGGFPETV